MTRQAGPKSKSAKSEKKEYNWSPTAYVMFMRVNSPGIHVSKEKPFDKGYRMRQLALMWKTLNDEEKQSYVKMAEIEREKIRQVRQINVQENFEKQSKEKQKILSRGRGRRISGLVRASCPSQISVIEVKNKGTLENFFELKLRNRKVEKHTSPPVVTKPPIVTKQKSLRSVKKTTTQGKAEVIENVRMSVDDSELDSFNPRKTVNLETAWKYYWKEHIKVVMVTLQGSKTEKTQKASEILQQKWLDMDMDQRALLFQQARLGLKRLNCERNQSQDFKVDKRLKNDNN